MPATGVAVHAESYVMSTQSHVTSTQPLPFEPPAAVSPVNSAAANPDLEEKRRKKRNKVRSAWISFVGRIIAQFIGAAATILLGMVLLQKYQTVHENSADRSPAVTAVVQHPTVAARERGFSGQPSLAVLPLEAFSTEPQQKQLAASMTEVLIAALAQVEGLRVISRTSSMNYQGVAKPLPDIGRELGVDLVLEGSVVRSGGRVRVIAQLINAKTDEHVWARSYGRPIRDTLAFQDAVAARIVRDMTSAIRRRESQLLTKSGVVRGILSRPAGPARTEVSTVIDAWR
jgi:TolB-like protein